MSEWLEAQPGGDVLWWYDAEHLRARFHDMRGRLARALGAELDFGRAIPIVIGGDWEFNAWACPAGELGDFLMLNLGFIHASTFAAAFMKLLEEMRGEFGTGPFPGIVASSMLGLAATTLGREEMQFSNLRLPPREMDEIWRMVQQPSDRLLQAISLFDAFVLLHELGHVRLGHLDVLRTWQRDPDSRGSNQRRIEQRSQMRAFEHEADRFACECLLRLDPSGDSAVEPLLILFLMLRLCEGRTTSRLTSTHPAAEDRLRACMEVLHQDPEKATRVMGILLGGIREASVARIEWQEQLKK